jgi:hypothetical protein
MECSSSICSYEMFLKYYMVPNIYFYIYNCRTYMGATAEVLMERVLINNIGCF